MNVSIFLFKNRRLGPGSYNIDAGGFNPKAVLERSAGPGEKNLYKVLVPCSGRNAALSVRLIVYMAY